ncbi:MAG: LysM peptidoglycan-binding domain-containing protein [Dehalococcoidia bacterium]|jgi:LysM repeat protein|nr:LysM peptidoglycan-binding domain-containing protein [Dehalococcoidia bacterium]
MNFQRTKRFGTFFGVVLLSQSLIACTQTSEVSPSGATDVTVATVATAQPVATYVVQRGDRMVDIAAEHDISLGALLQLNNIPNPDVIEIGDVIFLEAQPSAAVIAASETGSTTGAGVAAGAPVPTTEPLPRLVQIEAVDEPFSERLSQWWANAPKPSLSGDAVQQGVFAAVALPAAVIAFVLLLMLGRLALRLLRAALRIPRGRSSAASASEEQPESEQDELRPKQPRRLPSFAFVGRAARGFAVATGKLATGVRGTGIGWLTRPLAAFVRAMARAMHWVGRLIASGTHALASLLHLNARKAVGAHTARRERARDREFQRESRGWWSQGRERLRIGLIDEAEECFETGLRLAVEGGWQEEIELYRSELQLLEERRGVKRSLVPSAHEV